MRFIRALAAAALVAGLLVSPAVARKAPHASCAVLPDPATTGTAITVTVSGVTSRDAPNGWFALYDFGPTDTQAVSTMNLYPHFGDNGAYVALWDGSTAVFVLTVQEPGLHQVEAAYRGVFATCAYSAP